MNRIACTLDHVYRQQFSEQMAALCHACRAYVAERGEFEVLNLANRAWALWQFEMKYNDTPASKYCSRAHLPLWHAAFAYGAEVAHARPPDDMLQDLQRAAEAFVNLGCLSMCDLCLGFGWREMGCSGGWRTCGRCKGSGEKVR